jgi:bla regulator protein BlaR1
MRIRSRELLAVGIFGRSSLGDRLETLLQRGRQFSPRPSLGRVTVSAAVLLAFVAAGSLAPRWIAFAQQEPRPSFEVASVKPGDPNNPQFSYRQPPGGRYIATNVTLQDLIGSAYAVPNPRMSGGPNWLGSDRFTIEAKAAAPLPPWPESNKQLSLMLQSLLEDRFKLAVHWETKEAAVYDLVVAKGGPKLKEADGAENSGFGMERGRIKSLALPLGYLASNLAYLLGRPVIDKTGLSAKYDYTLSYTPDASHAAALPPPGPDAAPPDPNGPTIFTALQEQLGLRLESTKGPVDILVIDHVEKPDAN